jgi:DNA polymerase-3 subunit epsilon
MTKQFVLDTETTGLYPSSGDKIVEVAIIELEDHVPTGRVFHKLIDPERDIPQVVVDIHGIDNDKVKGCPTFSEICDEMMQFVGTEGELIAHNAPFDMDFLNHELKVARGFNMVNDNNLQIVCTRELSKRRYRSGRHRLDDLCDRLNVDRTGRTLHGALLDAQLLVECYVKLVKS